jgi:hypothetical protein
VYTSENAGTWAVSGEYESLSDTASLTVEAHGVAVAVDVTPDVATVTAGESVTYQATAEDAQGNRWDVTAETAFSIDAGAGGSWAANVYTSEQAGVWTVSGEYGALTDTATLHVEPGGEPTCVTIQRGTLGEVEDGYIWEAYPTRGSYTEIRLRSGLYTHPRYGPGETRVLLRFGLDLLPQDAIVQSATLGINEFSSGSGETVNVYRITEEWSESAGPAWNDFASSYDSTVSWASFDALGGLLTADVTDLVAAWVNGSVANYGTMLVNSPAQALDEYYGSEYSSLEVRPWLEVCYVAP